MADSPIESKADEAAARIRDLNEKVIASAKEGGNAALDAYESALQHLLELTDKAASNSPLEFVQSLAETQAKFISELSTRFVTAARDALK